MSLFNRLGNVANRYQTPTKRVLCLCSAGLLRSPTTANVLHREFGHNTRAAGIVDNFALIPVDDVLIEWAHEVVCVHPEIYDQLMHKFPNVRDNGRNVVVLNIPDKYEWNDPDLQKLIAKQYADADIMAKAQMKQEN